MISCKAVRARLADEGVEAADEVLEIKRHLESCAACSEFLNDLRRVESALRDLPRHDAPDAVVADTLRAVRQAANEHDAPARPSASQRNVAAGLAASVVIAAGLGLTFSFLEPSYEVVAANRYLVELSARYYGATDQLARAPVAKEAPSPILRQGKPADTETAARSLRAFGESESSTVEKGMFDDDVSETFGTAPPGTKKAELGERRSRQEGASRAGERGYYSRAERPLSEEEVGRELDIIARLEARQLGWQRDAGAAHERLEKRSEIARVAGPEEQTVRGTMIKDAASTPRQRGPSGAGQIVGDLRANTPQVTQRADNEPPESNVALAEDKDVRAKAQEGYAGSDLSAADLSKVDEAGKLKHYLVPPADPRRAHLLAARFLDDYQSLEHLSYQDPTGYWANSYIPGDTAMRLLQARLRAWDRTGLGGQDVRLEQAIRQINQPFDGPRDAALAVYLHADAPTIDGPTRLRVQVGLKGAERQGGHRPAMNVALVVDLRGTTDADSGARIRALISALERARQPGDRLSLTVAGPDGGLLVPPAEFRHGPLRVAMERMLGVPGEAPSANVDLRQAFTLATESVLEGDDPGTVLGSSLVLLVTGSSLAEELAELERMAHQNAVDGVTLSVVSLVAREDLQHIDRLVAAGQGNRRILDTAQAADNLIDRELHAASRAVARALRLRIRLAPGVKLVEVIGSRRLNEILVQRVREAEQAIDQRLARNYGIQADRGEDEEGIQIVIPNFYAGDTHTIQLDVVAQRPGPVADVTVRYKDVTYLKNGVTRANLTIGGGQRAAGPLELNVLKNLAAWEFARQARQVGRYLAEGDPQSAALLLTSLRDLVHGLRLEVAGWRGDPDLLADEAMLNEYLAVLATPAVMNLVQRQYLADSLRFAAFHKLQTAAR